MKVCCPQVACSCVVSCGMQRNPADQPCAAPQQCLCGLRLGAIMSPLTPPLQGLVQQSDWQPARVLWCSANGGQPVSCMWHAAMCHVWRANPCRSAMCCTVAMPVWAAPWCHHVTADSSIEMLVWAAPWCHHATSDSFIAGSWNASITKPVLAQHHVSIQHNVQLFAQASPGCTKRRCAGLGHCSSLNLCHGFTTASPVM